MTPSKAQFYAPTDYTAEQTRIERNRRLAEMLRQESSQPVASGQMAGGYFVPTSPLTHIAQALKGYTAAQAGKKADDESKALAQKYQSDLVDVLARGGKAQTGDPGMAPAMDPQEREQMADQGTPMPPNVGAVAPNPAEAASIYMTHPATQQLGMGLMQRHADAQALANALRGGQAPAGGTMPAGGAAPAGGVSPGLGLPPLEILASGPMGAKVWETLNRNQIEGAKLGVDYAKLLQAQQQWEGLSAAERADLALKGIGSALDLAKARDAGIDVSGLGGQPVAAPQPPAAPTPAAFPTVPPEVQAQRDAEAARIVAREGMPGGGGAIPSSTVLSPQQQREAAAERTKLQIKTEEDRKAAFPQAQLQVKSQIDDINRLKSLAQEVLKDPALDRSVGLRGALPSVPGSDPANVDTMIEALQSQISGMKLQAMRNASKTGGAVGQVTEREWPRLENMIVALKTKMSPEKFREKLGELVTEMDKMETNISQAFQQEYGQFTGSATSIDDLVRKYANPR